MRTGGLAATIAAVALLALPARAEPPTLSDGFLGWGSARYFPPADQPTADRDEVLEKSGAIMSGFAAGTLVGAGVTFGVAEAGLEECGLTGCFREPNRHARFAALAMITGAAGMGIIAVPAWLAGRYNQPWRRKSDRRIASGIVLTSVGTGSLAVSALMLGAGFHPEMVSFGGAHDRSRPPVSLDHLLVLSFVQGVSGLGMMVTGAALWGSGARTPRDTAIDAELHVGAGSTSLSLRF